MLLSNLSFIILIIPFIFIIFPFIIPHFSSFAKSLYETTWIYVSHSFDFIRSVMFFTLHILKRFSVRDTLLHIPFQPFYIALEIQSLAAGCNLATVNILLFYAKSFRLNSQLSFKLRNALKEKAVACAFSLLYIKHIKNNIITIDRYALAHKVSGAIVKVTSWILVYFLNT